MIVAFADRRRSSIESSHSTSNVIRKHRQSSSAPAPGQMIVAFGERRHKDGSRSQRSTRRSAAAPTRKQTLPAPTTTTRDPPGRMAADSTIITKGRQSSFNADEMVVEFPSEHRRNSSAARTKRRGREPSGSNEGLNLSGLFRKNCHIAKEEVTARAENSSSSNIIKKEQPPRSNTSSSSSTRKKQEKKNSITSSSSKRTLKFQDAVDWRHSSIDWGDEDDANDDKDTYDDHTISEDESKSDDDFCPAKIRNRRDGRRRRTSKVGNICNSSNANNVKNSHDSQSTSATENYLTDSNRSIGSSLTLSLTSLLGIQKLDT